MNLDKVFEEFYGSPIPPDFDRGHEAMQNVSINDMKGMMQIAIRQALELAAERAKATVKEYAKEKCREQRELCFKAIYEAKPKHRVHTTGGMYYQSMSQKEFRDTILNAPEPGIK